MRMQFWILSATLCLLLLFGFLEPIPTGLPGRQAYGQSDKDAYQERRDLYDARMEGIKEETETPVSGDKIILLSALIQAVLPEVDPIRDAINLGFFTPRNLAASVEIFCEPNQYYVDPIRSDWGPGLATFRWPTEIMRRHGISPSGLCARAMFIEGGERTLFPACLYFEDLPNAVEEYRFTVAPLSQMIMRYWIVDSEADTVVVTGWEQPINANQQRQIVWDGRDHLGHEVHEGEYSLKLEGTYRTRFGRRRGFPLSFRFFHKHSFDG
jgi:hypothetical protein